MKKLLTFLTLFTLFFTTAWAGAETIDLSRQGFENEDPVSSVSGETVTLDFSQGSKYYNTGSAVRIYGGGSVTVTASNKTITGITFTFSTSSYAPATGNYSVNTGSLFPDGNSSTWTGSATSVTLTRSNTGSGHWRLQKVQVFYTDGGGSTSSTYSLTLPSGLTGGNVTASGAEDLTAIPEGTEMTVTANPSIGYVLDWMKANGNTVGTPYTFNIYDDTEITAAFKEKPSYLFYESWSGTTGTGGNDGSWNGSIATNNIISDNNGWDFENSKGGANCIKMATGTTTGKAITPTITGLTSGKTYILTFRAAGWNGEGATLYISANGGNLSESSVTTVSSTWNEYTITFVANSTEAQFTFTTSNKKRTFLDDVMLSVAASPSVAKPVIEGETPFYPSTSVEITCATDDAVIYYTTDGSDPDNTSSEYSTAFELDHSATVKAVAYVGENASEIVEMAFTKLEAYNKIEDIVDLPDGTEFVFTGDLVVNAPVVTTNSGNHKLIYAQDGTGGIYFYNAFANTPSYNQFDKIPANFKAKKASQNGAPQLIEVKDLQDATVHEVELEVSVIKTNEISLDNVFTYSEIKGATFANNTITTEDGTVSIYNRFNTDLPSDNATYNVYGITSWNNGPQFLPLEFIAQGEPEYYLCGTINNWNVKDEDYKFTRKTDGTYILNNVNLPAGERFKVLQVIDNEVKWCGGPYSEGSSYCLLEKTWHANREFWIDNGADYYMNQFGGLSNVTIIPGTTYMLSVNPVNLYIKTSLDDFDEDIEMTALEDGSGWTITMDEEFAVDDKFGFTDNWEVWHGGEDAWVLEEYLGSPLNLYYSKNYIVKFAGKYIITVNNDVSKMTADVVPVLHDINLTAISDVPNDEGEGFKAGGTVTAKVNNSNANQAYYRDIVTLNITPWTGYSIDKVTVDNQEINPVEGIYSFTMPNSAVNVVVNFKVNYYDIIEDNDEEMGTISGLPETMKGYTGQPLSFTVTALGDNEIDAVSVTPTYVELSEANGTYSFNMPAADVTIKVTYKVHIDPCTIPFTETWDGTTDIENGCTGGNDDNWYGTNANGPIVADNLGWVYMKDNFTSEFNGYGAYKCIRLGDGSYTGSATTPEIIVTNGTIYKMTFKAGSWDSNVEALLSATGAKLYSDEECHIPISSLELPYRSWGEEGEQEHVVYVEATSSLMTISWATTAAKKRYFLDEVHITLFAEPEEAIPVTLADLCAYGEEGKLYSISNENGLLGVYKHGTSVWFKDENGESIDKQTPGDDDKFYVVDEGNNITTSEKDFDQSNWIEVVFPEDREEINYVSAYVKNLTGRLEDKNNPKLILTADVAADDVTYLTDPADEYIPNPYMAANFLGSQEYTNSQGVTYIYFFPMPKAQEYAKILWAIWDGDKMNMPEINNFYGFQGSFTLNDEYCSLSLTPGNSYDFEGIIRKVTGSKGVGDKYEVSPIRISDTPTAISTVSVNGNVKSVKYVNVAGIVSDTPFEGVNIVVTEYTDGSRTTTKMLKR